LKERDSYLNQLTSLPHKTAEQSKELKFLMNAERQGSNGKTSNVMDHSKKPFKEYIGL
jgi:hypothetical protein